MHRRLFSFHPALRQGRQLGCLLLVVISVGACRSSPSSGTESAAVSPETWAVVDGRAVTRDEVEKAFRRAQDPGRTLAPEEALTAKLTILEEMIAQDILLAKARDAGLEVPASELDAAYADAKKNITDDAFAQELSRRNLTAADMREGLRRELLVQKLMDREVKAKVTVSDQEVSDFFTANRAQFNLAEDAYHVAQIVVTPVREPQPTNRTGNDAATPQEAQRKVAMLMDRLKSGATFSELAADYSEDAASASRGGDMGFLPRSALDQVPPPLRDAVLKMQPGAARVVSEGGAHAIVLLVAREAAGQRELATPGVREQITGQLRSRKETLLRAAYLTSVRDAAEVTNHLARRLVQSEGKL
jgi:peptidyl-prolyl cis-trans isomerase SurA